MFTQVIRQNLFRSIDNLGPEHLADAEAVRGFLYQILALQEIPGDQANAAYIDMLVAEFCPTVYAG
jgi:hypothetical protein